jgi:hypothetical protein
MHHTVSMLNSLFHTGLGQTWLYLTRATNVPTVIGGIFRIFPNR